MSMTHMDGPFTPPCNRSVHHPPARRSKRHWNTWATSLSYQAGNAKVTARVLSFTFSAHHRSSTTPVRSETRNKTSVRRVPFIPPDKVLPDAALVFNLAKRSHGAPPSSLVSERRSMRSTKSDSSQLLKSRCIARNGYQIWMRCVCRERCS